MFTKANFQVRSWTWLMLEWCLRFLWRYIYVNRLKPIYFHLEREPVIALIITRSYNWTLLES